MCGINGGLIPEGRPPNREQITASLAAIAHRGPDDFGIHQDGGVFIGMRRLAIIDLEGGQQPISNEDGTVTVVFNGEIYNYKELIPDLKRAGHRFKTESDTEVLVHLWEEHGTEMCHHLRGMFAFAIWDARQQQLFVARDRFGKKPLYYTRTTKGGLLFASELKALRPLAKAAHQTWSIRPDGIYDFLSIAMVPQPRTIYREVDALPPASWMLFDGNRLRIERYWDLAFKPKLTLPYRDAQARARELIGEAVRLRLRSDVPLGVFLSSGMDSSIIAYEAARYVGSSLQTFTVSMGDKVFDESDVAARTAKTLGVRNTVLRLNVSPLEGLQTLVRQYDQPFADSSAIPSMAVSEMARQHVKVILNGDGGDELFAGYRRYLAADMFDQLSWLPPNVFQPALAILNRMSLKRRSPLALLRRFLRGFRQRPEERYLTWTGNMLMESDKKSWWVADPVRPTEDWVRSILPLGLSNLDTQICGDHRAILLSDLLVKMDIATMSASLEGRSPFMDHVLAEFAATLTRNHRLHGRTPKSILRDAYRGLLPDEVTGGPKRGFEIPLAAWLEGGLKPILRDTVGQRNARVRAWVNGSLVDDLLAGRIMGDRNRDYLVYALLVLELWLRQEEEQR